jgi:hypothetical protein
MRKWIAPALLGGTLLALALAALLSVRASPAGEATLQADEAGYAEERARMVEEDIVG